MGQSTRRDHRLGGRGGVGGSQQGRKEGREGGLGDKRKEVGQRGREKEGGGRGGGGKLKERKG